jgi:acetylornithine deacetylase/succinyl-diaminopimelate desuccinylase-like protein
MVSELAQFVLRQAEIIQQIPAPTFDEAARGRYVRETFAGEGLIDLDTDAVGNVYGRIAGRGSKPPLVISAHLDTVFPLETDLTLTHSQTTLAGPGIGDNSVAVAALIGLAHVLQPAADQLAGDIWLVANTAEEGLGDLIGMHALVDRFQDQPQAYIVLEGMALGQIYHRGLGVRRFRITVETRGGHSWVDYGRPSAIHHLAALVGQLTAMSLPSSPRSSLNVGTIRGGTSINTIAAQAELDLDLRSEDPATLTGLVEQVELLVKAASTDEVNFKHELIGDRPAGQLDIAHPLVQSASRTLKAAGFVPQLNIGSTDANVPLSRGYPAITVGVTVGRGAHTLAEYIEKAPVAFGLQQIINLIQDFLEA